MRPLGNPYAPTSAEDPEVLHIWLTISAQSCALEVFAAVSVELENLAQEHGRVLTGPPLTETFRIADPGVPRAALLGIPPEALPITVGLVHGFVRAARRNTTAALKETASASP